MAIKTITELKSEVNTTINTNGTRSITGATLNTALIDTIDSLSAVDDSLEERKANIDGSYDTMTVGLSTHYEYSTGKTLVSPNKNK